MELAVTTCAPKRRASKPATRAISAPTTGRATCSVLGPMPCGCTPCGSGSPPTFVTFGPGRRLGGAPTVTNSTQCRLSRTMGLPHCVMSPSLVSTRRHWVRMLACPNSSWFIPPVRSSGVTLRSAGSPIHAGGWNAHFGAMYVQRMSSTGIPAPSLSPALTYST